MPSLEQIISNIDTFLGGKIDEESEKERLIDELTTTVADLVQHPTLPVRSRLIALFKRFAIDEGISASLVTSLQTGIEAAREKDFQLKTEEIETLFFPLLQEQQEIVVARAADSVPNLSMFPPEEIFEVIEEAAIPYAQLLGSNVAEALAVKDPGALIKGRPLILQILRGGKADPIQIANLFQKISHEQRIQLTSLLSNSVTEAKKVYEERGRKLLRNGNVYQWVYDRLREINIPHQTAKNLAPMIASERTVEELDGLHPKQFRKLVVDTLSSVPYAD